LAALHGRKCREVLERVETRYSNLEPYSYMHSPALAAVEFIILPFYLCAFYGCSVKRVWDIGFKSFAAISRGEAPKPFTLPQAMFWFECFLPFIGGLLFTLSIYGTIRDYHNFGTGKIAVIVELGLDKRLILMAPVIVRLDESNQELVISM
jgi:hypothetical protein